MVTRLRTPGKIKALLKTNPRAYELWHTLVAIKANDGTQHEPLNDRARIILASSLLEQHLQVALLTHFPSIDEEDQEQMSELFEGDSAPLSTFSARIRMGYALGVFGPNTKKDLERLKGIRNACAHARIHVHFKDVGIEEECRKFNALKFIKWGGLSGPEPTTAEGRFFAVVAHYFMCFSTEEREGEMTPPLRYRLSPLGKVFS